MKKENKYKILAQKINKKKKQKENTFIQENSMVTHFLKKWTIIFCFLQAIFVLLLRHTKQKDFNTNYFFI